MNSGLQTRLVIDRATASRLGITPQALDNALYDAFGQRQISTIFTDLNQYRVVLEADPKMAAGPQALDQIFLRSAAGGSVPLSSLTRIESTTAPLAINHQGQFPVATVSFNLAARTSIGHAVDAIERAQAEMQIPPSIQAEFQGTAQAFRLSLVNTPFLILAALVTMYILLGVLYESYIHPVTILSTLPSAGVGALLSLMLFGVDFSVIALIGIILLIGIVKKNAILMIDFAIEAERKEKLAPRDAIFQACLLRFRPIMMTTMAALLGAVPLACGTGVGSELRRPLGISIIGGLIFSQVLTLYTTPVIYLYFDRAAKRLFPARARARGEADAGLEAAGTHEPVRALHPPAHRHFAADHGGGPGGDPGLQVPARVAPAPGGVPHHRRQRFPARGQPRDHGLLGGHPPGAAVRAHRRHHRDDLHQRHGRHGHHPAVRPEPQHRRRRPGRAGGHQRRPQPAARQPARATLPTARSTRPTPRSCCTRAHLGHPAPGEDVRRRLQHPAAEAVPGAGRGPGVRVGRGPARRAGGGQPLPPAGQGHRAWRTCAPPWRPPT